MQQTNQYKLNLIEKTDTFSPDPLNENAEKVEAQLAAETLARTAADTAETQARTAADAAEAKARADADTAETNARKSADTTEANTRAAAITAEAKARADADAAEVKNRNTAIAVETKARTDAVAAEAKARADAITAETNARKSADTSEANTRAAAVTALDNRVKKLEARRIVTGAYTGNNNSSTVYQNINLGFQPKYLLIRSQNMDFAVVTPDSAYYAAAVITDTGFKVASSSSNLVKSMNGNGLKYYYLAIL